MISKILRIRNIGRFRAVNAAGSVDFRRLTLLFAPNARGKTTIGAILRSLKTASPGELLGRKTFGSSQELHISLLVDGSEIRFDQHQWSKTLPNLQIFDETFITDNVYSGLAVEHEQKKNLYQIVIGEQGVRFAKEITHCDSEIRRIDHQLKDLERKIPEHIRGGYSVDEFVKLPVTDEISSKIAVAEQKLRLARDVRDLQVKPLLETLILPSPPSTIPEILATTLADLDQKTEERFREHLLNHTNGATEEWISDGLHYTKEGICPFCGQSLHGLDLIRSYRSYFSAHYQDFQLRIKEALAKIRSFGDESIPLRLRQVHELNLRTRDLWISHLELTVPALDLAPITAALTGIHRIGQEALEAKLLAPFELASTTEKYTKCLEQLNEEVLTAIAPYNSHVESLNRQIETKKQEAASLRAEEVEKRLSWLRAQLARRQPPVSNLADEMQQLSARRAALVHQKDTAKKNLNNYSDEIFGRWEDNINTLLSDFGADFKVQGAIPELRRRTTKHALSAFN